MFSKCFFRLAYLTRPAWDTGISPPELMDFIASHPPGRALDLGCGTGTNVVTLAKHGWKVTGVDFTPRALRKARRKVQANRVEVELLHDDVSRLEGISGPFDLVFDLGCYHSLPEEKRQPYLHNVKRLLAQDGVFLLYTFIKDSPDMPGPGTTQAHLQDIGREFSIVKRVDGSERGYRPSAWLTIRKRR